LIAELDVLPPPHGLVELLGLVVLGLESSLHELVVLLVLVVVALESSPHELVVLEGWEVLEDWSEARHAAAVREVVRWGLYVAVVDRHQRKAVVREASQIAS
jgi:hypothetical protein